MARPTKMNDDLVDKLVGYLKLGCYLETAAAMCGIDRDTLLRWAKRGAREVERQRRHDEEREDEVEADKQRQRNLRTEERQRRRKRAHHHKKLLKSEASYVAFHGALEQAIAQAELGDLAVISQAAKGGHLVEKRTIKDPVSGSETTIEKRSRPDWKASAFRLERRNPKRWGRRVEIAGDPENPIPITLADAVKRVHLQRRQQQAGITVGAPPNGAPSNGVGGDADEV